MHLLIEPINTRDIPGFFLNRQDQAHELIAEIGAANVKVQMDLYHCQIVEGDVAMKIRQYLPTGRVGHFQIAGVPERHEPDVGEMNYPYLFEVIDEVSQAMRLDGLGRLRIPAGARRAARRHVGRARLVPALARLIRLAVSSPSRRSSAHKATMSLPSSSCSTFAAELPTWPTARRSCSSLQSNCFRHQLTSRGSFRSISPRSAGTVSKT